VVPTPGTPPLDVQQWLLETAHRRAEEKAPLHILPRSGAPATSPAPD
jgi:hypothetical protein